MSALKPRKPEAGVLKPRKASTGKGASLWEPYGSNKETSASPRLLVSQPFNHGSASHVAFLVDDRFCWSVAIGILAYLVFFHDFLS